MAKTKQINLGLQGGGAHGAFTWGVLDRILEDERIEIAGMSGTSAGALNGAAVKSGIILNGRDGARENLNWLWGKMGAISDPNLSSWIEGVTPRNAAAMLELTPAYMMTEALSQFMTPYAYGPFYSNPLRSVVEAFNFDRVCADTGPALYICATKVRTGKIRVFSKQEISTDVILASACLPTIFKAVDITDPETGETDAYWDGGYTGNPALFPLFHRDLPHDILVVNINPMERKDLPITPQQIQNRINEISFNTSLLRELRAIAFVQRLLTDGTISDHRMRRIFVHIVGDDELMNELSVATKLVPSAPILARLKEAGRRSADTFLQNHFDDLGTRSSVDLQQMFS